MCAWLCSCATSTTSYKNPYQDAFDAAGVRSILILPAYNASVNVDASGTLASVLPDILGDQGYYVFPINTVKRVLENEGLYDPGEIYQLSGSKLANMFGANAVLFVSIEEWDARYVLLSTTTGVTLSFSLVAADGAELWRAEKTVEVTSGDEDPKITSDNLLGSLLGSAISAAMERAFPDYRPLARQASEEVFLSDETRIPTGPYHSSKRQPGSSPAAADKATAAVSQ